MGEWNLQLKAGVKKLKSRYLLTVDRRFGPPARRLSPYECRALPVLPSDLPLLPDTMEFDTLPLLSLSERLHKLPEVDVKAKRVSRTVPCGLGYGEARAVLGRRVL